VRSGAGTTWEVGTSGRSGTSGRPRTFGVPGLPGRPGLPRVPGPLRRRDHRCGKGTAWAIGDRLGDQGPAGRYGDRRGGVGDQRAGRGAGGWGARRRRGPRVARIGRAGMTRWRDGPAGCTTSGSRQLAVGGVGWPEVAGVEGVWMAGCTGAGAWLQLSPVPLSLASPAALSPHPPLLAPHPRPTLLAPRLSPVSGHLSPLALTPHPSPLTPLDLPAPLASPLSRLSLASVPRLCP
jgi:hypothetical protein